MYHKIQSQKQYVTRKCSTLFYLAVFLTRPFPPIVPSVCTESYADFTSIVTSSRTFVGSFVRRFRTVELEGFACRGKNGSQGLIFRVVGENGGRQPERSVDGF